MASGQHQGNWYVLVSGLRLAASPVTVASGLALRALDSPLSVFDLASAGAVGFRAWALLEPHLPECHCEIESAADASVTPGYDTLNRVWLLSALLTLRGFGRHLCLAANAYPWSAIAGHRERTSGDFREQLTAEGVEAAVYRPKGDLPPFTGTLLDYHLTRFAEREARTGQFAVDDASWISGSYDTCNRIASESGPFRYALEAATDWRYATDPRAAIARLWGGIEGLFGVSSELVYRLSLLAASLLAPRGPSRKAKFESVRKLYGLRSKAVHGEPLGDAVLAGAMNDSYHLLRDLILSIITKGHLLTSGHLDDAVFS